MTTCRTPEKYPYLSRRAAHRARRELEKKRRAGHGRLHVYRCGAHWHVGH